MDTKILEYIIAIAEEKSITKAADKVFLSQPALSQHLRKIETEIGTPLFIRNKQNWQLTDVGKVYIYGARGILNIYKSSIDKLEEIKLSNNDKINIIIANNIFPFFKSYVLSEFSTLYPDIEINIQSGNSIQIHDYIDNGLPYLTIFYDRNNISNKDSFSNKIEYFSVFEDKLMLCINKKSPLNSLLADNFDASVIKNEFFILSKTRTSHRDMQNEFFNHFNINPRIISECSDFYSAIHMLNNSYGCTFLPHSLCHNQSKIFNSYELPIPLMYNIYYGYPHGNLPKQYKNIIEILKNKFSTHFIDYNHNIFTEQENSFSYLTNTDY